MRIEYSHNICMKITLIFFNAGKIKYTTIRWYLALALIKITFNPTKNYMWAYPI